MTSWGGDDIGWWMFNVKEKDKYGIGLHNITVFA